MRRFFKQFSQIAVLQFLALAVLGPAAYAKEGPLILNWPDGGTAIVRITMGKFVRVSSNHNQQNWSVEVSAVNLWTKPLTASFSVYAFDKQRARVGEGYIRLAAVAPNQTVKFAMYLQTIGVPEAVTLHPDNLPAELRPLSPAREVSLTVYSVPSGASLRVDGKDSGVTPVAIRVTEGKHDLEFGMAGYRTGHFPLVISPDQVSGGTVSFELGGVSYDTVELRDGTVINGDVQYVSATDVGITSGGELHSYDRNSVKRILFVQRDLPQGSTSAPSAPVAQKP